VGRAETAGVRIVRWAGRNRKHAGAGRGDLVLGGGGRNLGGRGSTGKDENDNESSDNMLHGLGPFEVLFIKLLITRDPETDREGLVSRTQTAGVGIVRRAGRNRKHAGADSRDLVLG
jgi:hypothetical protein